MAPKYTKPEAPIPVYWPNGEAYEDAKAPADAPTAPEMSWKDFFTDMKLQQVIKMALNNNRDLRIAALNVERGARNVRHPEGRTLSSH